MILPCIYMGEAGFRVFDYNSELSAHHHNRQKNSFIHGRESERGGEQDYLKVLLIEERMMEL